MDVGEKIHEGCFKHPVGIIVGLISLWLLLVVLTILCT